MKIMVVGGLNGQLANSLRSLKDKRFCFIGRPEFDFTKPDTIKTVFEGKKPLLVVNTAAWTAVDAAETNSDEVYQLNCDGPAMLAKLCAVYDVPLIHISTDYVFDGKKTGPYLETDPVSPQTVYGKSKAEGEKAILAAHPKTIILRTAWVYSAHGKNFVKSMITLGASHSLLKVVGDQKGNPTCSDDLASSIQLIANQIIQKDWQDKWSGIYHAVGTGEASWYDLACFTLEQAKLYGQPMPKIISVETHEWPTPAKRPKNSKLNTDKLAQIFGIKFPHWSESVQKVVGTVFAA
ncbi:dTDP-4-dehydrorhamnose reductase [Commensalibacter sp. Nvir]|uniref:dTDP-4-dehydrorhamnose reductase n=1 Tax=Commensalibacter sp. Nvir TaxID=3069817 RepID=UPI002D5F31BF|nr:dTDP-4-dehydrorhamnose reductase [Commensalibacter sp. Nvir]